jgi:hypothetical protein
VDSNAIFVKTAEGQREIATRALKLTPRLRALLILIDGQSNAATIAEKAQTLGAIVPMLAELHAKGLIASLQPPPGSAQSGGSGGGITPSISEARRYAIDQMLALLGPGADAFTARLEVAQTRDSLLAEAERCRQALTGAAGSQKAERFLAGVKERLG